MICSVVWVTNSLCVLWLWVSCWSFSSDARGEDENGGNTNCIHNNFRNETHNDAIKFMECTFAWLRRTMKWRRRRKTPKIRVAGSHVLYKQLFCIKSVIVICVLERVDVCTVCICTGNRVTNFVCFSTQARITHFTDNNHKNKFGHFWYHLFLILLLLHFVMILLVLITLLLSHATWIYDTHFIGASNVEISKRIRLMFRTLTDKWRIKTGKNEWKCLEKTTTTTTTTRNNTKTAPTKTELKCFLSTPAGKTKWLVPSRIERLNDRDECEDKKEKESERQRGRETERDRETEREKESGSDIQAV